MSASIHSLCDHRARLTCPVRVTPSRGDWTTISFGEFQCDIPPKWLREFAEVCNDAIWSQRGGQFAAARWVVTSYRGGFEIDAFGWRVGLTDLQFLALARRLAERVGEVEAMEQGVRR